MGHYSLKEGEKTPLQYLKNRKCVEFTYLNMYQENKSGDPMYLFIAQNWICHVNLYKICQFCSTFSVKKRSGDPYFLYYFWKTSMEKLHFVKVLKHSIDFN